jgi:hypothetical protein
VGLIPPVELSCDNCGSSRSSLNLISQMTACLFKEKKPVSKRRELEFADRRRVRSAGWAAVGCVGI